MLHHLAVFIFLFVRFDFRASVATVGVVNITVAIATATKPTHVRVLHTLRAAQYCWGEEKKLVLAFMP